MNNQYVPLTLLIVAIINAVIHWNAILNNNKMMVRLSKCPFCLIMGLFLFVSLEETPIVFILGYIFSFLGDFFLLFEGNIFLVGMLSFGLAHICNAYAFISVSALAFEWTGIFVFILVFIYWTILKNYTILPEYMRKIVYGYLTIISIGFYGSVCLFNNAQWTLSSRLVILIGYLFFILSDSILGVSLWVKTNSFIRFLVMFTYYIAQFLLGLGYVLGLNENQSLIPI
ncbi:hypothetical protein ENUP19_0085G0121 [Entamoeba nuttalli]|uniref:YhhN family protein n=2 Tax=Entamoeba nuttalli TaxID=412467 RepID=K2HN42_ENTNP|nr:YhhN family protein [Entamoeba nuttalli P19]EKE37240.1 YhhN family protein [Entamoeba nuttalli P19]|eukprot:XP_008860423.1 YhhN family protein [Entamoeba nuttalli P19]